MLSVEAKERFIKRIKFKGPVFRKKLGPCWNWIGRLSKSGYGEFDANCKTYRAHRISYELFVDKITNGLHVLHDCDNPRCVRPKHLWLGTHQDNMRDRDEKGRQVTLKGDLNPSRLHPERLRRGDNHPARLNPEIIVRGNQHGRSKLSDVKVYLSRALRNLGCSLKDLGIAFDVDRSAVGFACRHNTWQHVDEPPKNLNVKMWYKKHKNEFNHQTRELVESLIKVYVYS